MSVPSRGKGKPKIMTDVWLGLEYRGHDRFFYPHELRILDCWAYAYGFVPTGTSWLTCHMRNKGKPRVRKDLP